MNKAEKIDFYPVLTIAIPCYNGARVLDHTLKSILSQLNDTEIKNKVEVLVCDDGSSDNSVEVLSGFCKLYEHFIFKRNEKNLGFDRNIDKIINESQGRFCWTLSQDEAIEPGSLRLLLSILESNPEVAYVCISNKTSERNGKDAQYCKDGNEWLQLGLNGGLISQNIFNKNFLPQDRSRYYGNLWFHFSLALEMIAHRPAILVKNIFEEPRSYECRWAKGGFAFFTYTSLKRILQDLEVLGYDKVIIKRLLKGFAKDLPRNVASARLQGLNISWKVIKILFIEFYCYPMNLLFALFTLLLPICVLKVLKTILIKN